MCIYTVCLILAHETCCLSQFRVSLPTLHVPSSSLAHTCTHCPHLPVIIIITAVWSLSVYLSSCLSVVLCPVSYVIGCVCTSLLYNLVDHLRYTAGWTVSMTTVILRYLKMLQAYSPENNLHSAVITHLLFNLSMNLVSSVKSLKGYNSSIVSSKPSLHVSEYEARLPTQRWSTQPGFWKRGFPNAFPTSTPTVFSMNENFYYELKGEISYHWNPKHETVAKYSSKVTWSDAVPSYNCADYIVNGIITFYHVCNGFQAWMTLWDTIW